MSGGPAGRDRLGRLLAGRPWLGPLLALVVVFVLFAALRSDTFLRPHNLETMLRQTAVVGIGAAGMTLVVIMGGIDLSVGSGVALTTVLVALALRNGHSPVFSAVLAIVALAGIGSLSGLLVARLKITPFIVTLGAMSILRGVAKGLADEQKIDVDARGLDALAATGGSALSSPAIWLMVAAALGAAFVLRMLPVGRHIAAIGSNEAAARLAGVPVARVKVLVYAAAGALAGVAGIVEFATLTVGDPTDSIGLELEVIAAVVIGGGSLSGGAGSVAGALLGALLMTVIKTGCTHVGLPNWVQEVLTGAIIVLAVVVDRARARDER